MSEVACHAMVPAPTLTKIVDRLVDTALVHRRPDETDRRRVLVFLSDHGREMHTTLAPAVARAERELAEELGETDLQQLMRLLARLAGWADNACPTASRRHRGRPGVVRDVPSLRH